MTFFYCDDRAYEHFLSQECEVSLYDWRFLSYLVIFRQMHAHANSGAIAILKEKSHFYNR